MDKIKLLKSKKLNVTDFRLAVLSVFEAFENAISLEQIEEKLGDFDRITLYRTIKGFKDKGIIHEILLNDTVKKLALCSDSCEEEEHHHEHIHFHCDQCHELYCLDIPSFPRLALIGYTIKQMEIQASGICQNCQ